MEGMGNLELEKCTINYDFFFGWYIVEFGGEIQSTQS